MESDQFRAKLLAEISRLKDDLKLLEQEEPGKQQGIRLAECQARIRNLIARLEKLK